MESEQTEELDFDRYETILHTHPYDVLYKSESFETYSDKEYSFSISSPGYNSLMSKEVFVQWNIEVQEVAHYINNMFENYALNCNPTVNDSMAFRSGNILARCTSKVKLQINNKTYIYFPNHYHDIMNRLYVSNDQSSHEFAASGGKFDEGNFSSRNDNVRYACQTENENMVPDNFAIEDEKEDEGLNTHLDVYLHNVFTVNGDVTSNPLTDFLTNLRPSYPVRYDFYNPGYSERCTKFALGVRETYVPLLARDMNSEAGFQFRGAGAADRVAGATNANRVYQITLTERLPIPLFKMYSNDGNDGVLPGIRSIKYSGTFLPLLEKHMFRTKQEWNVGLWNLYWYNIDKNSAKIITKWFVLKTPLPKQISINFPKYETQVFTTIFDDLLDVVDDQPEPVYLKSVNFINISLNTMPDLILFYFKFQSIEANSTWPDSYQLSIYSPDITYNHSSGKLLNITPIQMYENWKKNLKYFNMKIISFEEWFRYCCVLCVKPEDFGVKVESEYNKPVLLNFKCSVVNQFIIPSVITAASEYYEAKTLNLIVHSIYTRNKAYITDGTFDEFLPMSVNAKP